MRIKTIFALLVVLSFVPALSAVHAVPTADLRIVVAEPEFTEDDGTVIIVPTLTSSPGILENNLYTVPFPFGEIFKAS